jgi:hypothetical protein
MKVFWMTVPFVAFRAPYSREVGARYTDPDIIIQFWFVMMAFSKDFICFHNIIADY